MLRASAIDFKYKNIYFSKCCSKQCLPITDIEGNYDFEKTTRILKFCESQVRDVSQSKLTRRRWWMQKLNACFSHIGEQGQRVGFNYHIGGINSTDELRVSNVCQKTFIEAYGITSNKLITYQKIFKARKFGRLDPNGQQSEQPPNIDVFDEVGLGNGRQRGLNNIYEAKSLVVDEYDLESSCLETLQGMVVPDTEEALHCWTWMKDYFSLAGEPMPNSAGEIHLSDNYTKYSVYKDYVRDMEEMNALGNNPLRILCRSQFLKLWDAIYPMVKVRKFKLVSGKCKMCALLSELRCSASSTGKRDVKERVNELILLHRSFYMKERQKYYERRRLARENPKEYMSIISDGMAQVHCELPWQANLDSFPAKLTQHFQGVLEHGKKVSIFRTFENVGTGSNLAVHSMLRVLENRWIQDGKLPDTIFIQIDGGGENTAKITLAMCEFLVAKGLTKKIILSRLPVGHTHEDIDAVFAHIWKKVQGKHCLTPQAYKRIVEVALTAAGRAERESQVYDLFAIPDYVKYFTPMLDGKFTRYCRMEYTQHQFCFERAVEGVSAKYPLGVKVQYRRYAQDEAIELRKILNGVDIDKEVPISAHIVESVWHYQDGSGISLFKEGAVPGSEIKVAPFNLGSAERYLKVLDEVKKRLSPSCHQEWDEFTPLVPTSDDANEYINNVLGGYLHVPFKFLLFNGAAINTSGVIESHVVGRRGYRVEALPRERAPACVATRDRNQDVLREEQASKRAEQATKRALTKAASKKNVDGNGDKISQGIKRTSRGGTTESSHRGPTSSLVTDAHQNEMIAEPKLSAAEGMRSARIVTSEAKAVQRNSAKSDGTLVLNKALTEAEPKFAVLESQLPMSEADNSDEGEAALGESVDTEDWEGKPTVTWNEETVYVRQRWDAHDVPGTQLSTQNISASPRAPRNKKRKKCSEWPSSEENGNTSRGRAKAISSSGTSRVMRNIHQREESVTARKLTTSYFVKNPHSLRGARLKVWYPNEDEAGGGSYWNATVQKRCGRRRWHVVFDDGSYSRDLSLTQIVESIVRDESVNDDEEGNEMSSQEGEEDYVPTEDAAENLDDDESEYEEDEV